MSDSKGAAIEKEIQRLMDAYWGVSGHNRDEKRPIYSEAILAILAQEVNRVRIDELKELQMADTLMDDIKDTIYNDYIKDRLERLG